MQLESDSHFAEVMGMGRMRKVYAPPKTNWHPLIVFGPLLLAVLAAVILMGGPLRARLPFVYFLLWAVVLGLVEPVALMLAAELGGPRIVALYDGGLAQWHRGRLTLIRWADVLRIEETWRYSSGEYGGSTTYAVFRLHIAGGRKWTLPGNLQGGSELSAEILDGIQDAILRQPLAALASGENLYFRPYHLSAQGIEITERGRERFANWEDILALEEHPLPAFGGIPEVTILVRTNDPTGRLRWAATRKDQISDAAAFVMLCKHLIARNRGG